MATRRDATIIHHPRVSPAHTDTTARWAVGLASAAFPVLLVGLGVWLVALLSRDATAIEGTWVTTVASGSVYLALAVSLLGLAVGLKARLGRESFKGLWLAFAVFPGLLAMVAVLDVFVIK